MTNPTGGKWTELDQCRWKIDFTKSRLEDYTCHDEYRVFIRQTLEQLEAEYEQLRTADEAMEALKEVKYLFGENWRDELKQVEEAR